MENGAQETELKCAVYNKLYPDLSNTVVTIATLSSLDLGPYIRCGLSGVWCPPWCRVTRAGSLTAESRRRVRLSQHFSSVVLLSAGHSTIINHKLLFHGNPAILLLQNHCHHDPPTPDTSSHGRRSITCAIRQCDYGILHRLFATETPLSAARVDPIMN